MFSDLSHVKMNATKSMIGHCLGAAGGMEAIATIQAIRTGWVHPTINHVSKATGGVLFQLWLSSAGCPWACHPCTPWLTKRNQRLCVNRTVFAPLHRHVVLRPELLLLTRHPVCAGGPH